jgi:hypothetical protein
MPIGMIVEHTEYLITVLLIKRQRLKAQRIQMHMAAIATPRLLFGCEQDLFSKALTANVFV